MSDNSKKRQNISINAVNHNNIYWPGLDDGMAQLSQEEFSPKILDYNSDIQAFIAVSGRQHRQHLFGMIRRYKRLRSFSAGVVFPSQIVAADDVRIDRAIVTIGDKFLISGASGSRIIVKLSQATTGGKIKKFKNIAKSFSKNRNMNDLTLPFASQADRGLDFVIIAKNLFNYYHFTLETLPYLTLYKKYKLTGRIIIHSPSDKIGSFVHDQVQKFFPEIADRVYLQFGGLDLPRALVVLDSRFLYYQASDECIPSFDHIAPRGWMWRDKVIDKLSHKTLSMNSCSAPLMEIRDKVLKQIKDSPNTIAEPIRNRRIYVSRRPTGRPRPIENEPEMAEMLDTLRFETIYFEDYNVLEQARLVSEASVIVTVHGAGVANMLYAHADCLVIELSSLQIALLRFGDFNPFAIASKARYSHFFVDHYWEDQETIPNFAEHSIVGLKISSNAIEMLRSIILAHLQPDELANNLSKCEKMNADEEYEALNTHLTENFGHMLHLPDPHVWAANCATRQGTPRVALEHLVKAAQLAPWRRKLYERALKLAKRLDASQHFDELAFDFFHHMNDDASSFFDLSKWDSAHYQPNPPVSEE